MSENTSKVYLAEPYRPCQLGSFGKASCMLLRQFNFPDTYSEKDTHVQQDHDHCQGNHADHCFKKHTGRGELALEEWVKNATDEKIMNFLIDILEQSKKIKWTGYRIMGGVHRGNGFPVWTLELFAKHPKSNTEVYTGLNAPNVLPGPRYSDQ